MAIYPELAGKVAVVTGAANGIGAATARAFGEQRARVVLLDLDIAGATAVEAEIGGTTAGHLAVQADVTDASSVASALQRVEAERGRIEILVNCAGGYGRLATVADTDDQDWDRTIALNLRSVFLCCRAVIPSMKAAGGGRIINVASISGRSVVAASSPAYGAAKAGVIQLTRFLARELGPHGITANSIAPITTLTPRVAALRTEEDISRISAQIPLGRLAIPEDHANAMLFLASDSAAYINGVVLDVNGGRLMI